MGYHTNLYSVRFLFRQKFTLDDDIEFHAFAPLEAGRRVTIGIPLGCPRFLPVRIVTCVQTLKADCVYECDSAFAEVGANGLRC
jgi:hypothetical protein